MILDVFNPDVTKLSRKPDGRYFFREMQVEGGRPIRVEVSSGYDDAAQLLRGRYPSGMPAAEVVEIISAVADAFAKAGYPLSKDAFISVLSSAGAWEIKEGPDLYHVYRSADQLPVYTIPAA